MKKNKLNPSEFVNIFRGHVQNHSNSTCIYTDGSKAINGLGFTSARGDRCVYKKFKHMNQVPLLIC